MAIRKLKSGQWQATYENKTQGIKRLRRNFKTRKAAQEWEAAARAGVHAALIGRRQTHTFGEALARYLAEISTDNKTDKARSALAETLAWPIPYGNRFISLLDCPLEAPPGQLQIIAGLAAWRADMRQIVRRSYLNGQLYQLRTGQGAAVWYHQPKGQPVPARVRVTDSRQLAELDMADGRGPYSPDTLRTRQALVKAVLRVAFVEWEWTQADLSARVSLERPSPGREHYLTAAQLQALIQAAHTYAGADLADAIEAAALIGWRRQNLLGLTWRHVHFPEAGQFGYIVAPAEQVKTRRPLAQPMSERLAELLKARQAKAAGDLVFHRGDGQAFADFRKIWHTVKRAAGVDPALRWHDLRHTWASRLIQAGATDRQLMELGGWSSPEMPRRYAHLRLEHLQEIVNK